MSESVTAVAVRLTGVRALIAKRMQQSLADAAQLTFSARFDASRLLDQARLCRVDCASIRPADLIAQQYIRLLCANPDFNATLHDGVFNRANTVDLGFAVATPSHLVVPIIRNTEPLSLAELAERRRDLSTRALDGTLIADEMQGGTSTISNLGPGRTEAFTPILNPPQVALLGVAGINEAPWVDANGALCVRPVGTLSLTVDHRVIDGAPANRFLTTLCERLEQR